jgi:hypothetical protein
LRYGCSCTQPRTIQYSSCSAAARHMPTCSDGAQLHNPRQSLVRCTAGHKAGSPTQSVNPRVGEAQKRSIFQNSGVCQNYSQRPSRHLKHNRPHSKPESTVAWGPQSTNKVSHAHQGPHTHPHRSHARVLLAAQRSGNSSHVKYEKTRHMHGPSRDPRHAGKASKLPKLL